MSKQQHTTETAARQPVTSELCLGYAVEVADTFAESFEAFKPAYFLRGPRGGHYALFRTKREPSVMFVVNARTGNADLRLKGNAWFGEVDGQLVALR